MKRLLTITTCASVIAFTSIANAAADDWTVNSKALQVYGQMRVSIDSVDDDTGTNDGTDVNSNASRIGMKGEFDIDISNTKAIYKAELRYETTDAVSGDFDSTAGKNRSKQVEFRDAYAGLKGKHWGRLRVGRLSTEYKTTLTSIDPWNDNIPQSRSGGRQGSSELHSSYFNSAIDYKSPTFGNTYLSAFYVTKSDGSTQSLHNTGTLKNYRGGTASGIGIKYKTKSLFLSADYIDMDAETITKTGLLNDSGWQVAGRFKTGPFSVAALYEDVEDLGLGKNTYINGIYKIGNTRIILGYGTNTDSLVYGNDDYTNTSIGAKYSLGKKSELFAAYNNRTNDTTDNKDIASITVGMNIKFGY